MVPPGELLLSTSHHDAHQRGHQGSLTNTSLANRIRRLVAWINQEATTQDLPGQTIPADPHGPISPSRWRRTLACA
ncbi:hypothetical protein GCM10009639_55340 [Kitasatospora putterlickiae]|uniref:Integrase n=1 Tax=Kitasatospora putterlickiae TaxID=221725 RepID=A0ABN1YEQ6_9ACTN